MNNQNLANKPLKVERIIEALQQEIMALQKRLELSNAERDANTQRMIELEQGKGWTPVTERMPENETDVLIAFTREGLNGDIYRCVGMAFHTDGKSNSEDSSYWWDPDNIDDLEYDEETDAYIIPKGWWETVDFGENFTAVDVPVTHWMPLPKAPEAE